MHRVDALRTPSRMRVGYQTLLQLRGRYDFSRLKTSPWLPHVRVGNRVFSTSLDDVFKMYIHLSNVLTDHLNILTYTKVWLLPNTDTVLYYDLHNSYGKIFSKLG